MKDENRIESVCLVLACVSTLFLASCSHQGQMAASGKIFRVGGEGCSIMYVNGLLTVAGTRENAETMVEANDNDAIGNPSDVKTIRTVRFRTGPIISGYAVDMAKVCPDAAVKYVENMPELNKTTVEPVKTEPAKESSSIVKPILQKIKDAIGGDDQAKVIVGDGTYTALAKDRSIKYQSSLCTELLAYADDEVVMPGSGEGLKSTLIHFAGRLGQLVAKKKDVTKMRISKATIEGGRLTYLIYLLEREDGTEEEVDCPSCFEIED